MSSCSFSSKGPTGRILGRRCGTVNRRSRSCGWRVGSDDLQLIADLRVAALDGAAGQLDDALHLHADGGDAKGRQAAPQLDDLEVAIEADDIDAEHHEKSMDAGGGLDP